MRLAALLLSLALALPLTPLPVPAQAPKPEAAAPKTASEAPVPKPNPHCADRAEFTERTFYLNNAFQSIDANEIVTALRNSLDPCDKLYLVASQSAIVAEASPDELALAQKLITDLDRPKRTYRLTYTVTEADNDRKIGTQHFSMIVASGQETQMKQGTKVPLATGSYSPTNAKDPAGVQTQFTYVDVGMNFSATLDEFANGVRLRSDVVESGVAGQSTIAGVEEPIIRNTELKGAAYLTPGKPLMLGSIDIPGSTRRLDIEVVMEQLH